MNKASRFFSLSACFLLLTSCAGGHFGPYDERDHDPIDPDKKLVRKDFKDLYKTEAYTVPPAGGSSSSNAMEPPIPDLAEILAAPKPPKIAATQLVSVAVTDDVPLKDVLIELARLADIDIEVDSGITGGISFRAKDRPFNEVIERITDMAGLRYKVKNNVLRVERDTPYIYTYALDMLNLTRTSQSDISIGSAGSSSGGSGGSSSSGGGVSGSSSSSITLESKSDFWEKFTESITRILAFQSASLVSSTSIASQPNPDFGPGSSGDAAAPAPVAVPISGAGNADGSAAFFSLNQQAGTITISGTHRQHDMVKEFLKKIQGNISAQVLIEAKIVEVSLNDRYQTGINWNKLGGQAFGDTTLSFQGDFDSAVAAVAGQSPGQVTFLKDNIFGTNIDLDGAVSLLEEFGTARALSSPRLHAMNNQQAVLSFVENVLYFEIDCEVTPPILDDQGNVTAPATIEATSEDQTAPVGIFMTLQPSINKETNEVTLSIRPTLTRITQFVSDPGFEICKAQAASASLPATTLLALENTESKFPQIETRELDSLLKVASGQIMVIGGLLEDSVSNIDSGVPGASDVPYVGNLFKNVDKKNVKKELIILLRATIVEPGGYIDHADKNVYQKFITDPRPIQFPAP